MALNRLIIVFFTVIVSSTSAQELKLKGTTFNENFETNVPVSGRVVVGAQIMSTESESEFAVRMPNAPIDTTVCFRVQSRDGTYSSENEYIVSESSDNNIYKVTYPSKYGEYLSSFDETGLAVVAFAGACDVMRLTKLIPAYRGSFEAAKANKTLVIFANSSRSQVFIRLLSDEMNKTLTCERIQYGTRTSFDTLCEVEFADLEQGSNKLIVYRRQSGRMLPPVELEVVL